MCIRDRFTADPRKDPAATLIREATAGDEMLEAMAGGAGSAIGKGGMITKVIAAKRAAQSGAHTAIASGRESDVIARLANGEAVGTLLVSQTQPLAARKQWLADHLQLAGRLLLDAGAVNAPVSYTHLDVYKRQLKDGTVKFAVKGARNRRTVIIVPAAA